MLASLHERAGQSGEHLLRRYAAAMKHPLVTLITHPTNRQVPYKPGYDLDYDALLGKAGLRLVRGDRWTIEEVPGATPAQLVVRRGWVAGRHG